jgi:dynein heavy chain, axonemal
MIVVTKESEEASKVAEVVGKDEAVAQASADVAAGIKAECEAGLAEAMPALNSAVKALDTLSSKDISEIKVRMALSKLIFSTISYNETLKANCYLP